MGVINLPMNPLFRQLKTPPISVLEPGPCHIYHFSGTPVAGSRTAVAAAEEKKKSVIMGHWERIDPSITTSAGSELHSLFTLSLSLPTIDMAAFKPLQNVDEQRRGGRS